MTIKQLVDRSFGTAQEKGWYDRGPRNVPEMLCLIHSEISEALEDYRDNKEEIYYEGEKPCGLGIELADALVRIGDLCGYLKIDLDKMLEIKMNYNECRPYRHGNKEA